MKRSSDTIIREIRDIPIDSYTSKIMTDTNKSGEDKILEKIGEESAEVIIASKNDEDLVYEATDLIFHTLLLLVYKGVDLDDLYAEFDRRRG